MRADDEPNRLDALEFEPPLELEIDADNGHLDKPYLGPAQPEALEIPLGATVNPLVGVNPMIASGDMIVGPATTTKLPLGEDGQILTYSGGKAQWTDQTPAAEFQPAQWATQSAVSEQKHAQLLTPTCWTQLPGTMMHLSESGTYSVRVDVVLAAQDHESYISARIRVLGGEESGQTTFLLTASGAGGVSGESLLFFPSDDSRLHVEVYTSDSYASVAAASLIARRV